MGREGISSLTGPEGLLAQLKETLPVHSRGQVYMVQDLRTEEKAKCPACRGLLDQSTCCYGDETPETD